jgi:hypothetical protein
MHLSVQLHTTGDSSPTTALAEIDLPQPPRAVGTRLLVVPPEGGALVHATVKCSVTDGNGHAQSHKLRFSDGRISHVRLSDPYNNCTQAFDSAVAYRDALASYCTQLAHETALLADSTTGVPLRTREQLMHIPLTDVAGVSRAGYSDAKSICELAEPLLAPAPDRARRCQPTQPVLVRAGPGTGKTWSCVQLAHELALRGVQRAHTDDVPFVPCLVYVQRLARMLIERPRDAELGSTILLEYFLREYGVAEKPRTKWLSVLAQAVQMRTLIVLLDGIDEAAGRREAISRLVRLANEERGRLLLACCVSGFHGRATPRSFPRLLLL